MKIPLAQLADGLAEIQQARSSDTTLNLANALVDVRINLSNPISKGEIDAIEQYVKATMRIILSPDSHDPNRPVTAAGDVDELLKSGADLRGACGQYRDLVVHYYDDEVQEERRKRTTDVVLGEVSALRQLAKVVQQDLIVYLDKCYEYIIGLQG